MAAPAEEVTVDASATVVIIPLGSITAEARNFISFTVIRTSICFVFDNFPYASSSYYA
jgi:hypothetical protein